MNWIKSLYRYFTNYQPGTGATLDLRSDEERQKDFRFEEIVATATPVTWISKPREKWRSFPEQDQHKTFSCVAQSIKKMMGVWYTLKNPDDPYLEFSAAYIYEQRKNKPRPGMSGVGALEIARKDGTSLESLVPSTQANDMDMDRIQIHQYERDIAKVFRATNYLTVEPGNIDTIASIIQTTRKAVMVWFYFTQSEWSQFTPQIQNPGLTPSSPGLFRHSVAAVDYSIVNGEKCLIIEDSAHFGGLSTRVVTEQFFKARNVFAAYLMGFQFDDQLPTNPLPEVLEETRPRYDFKKDLVFGQEDADIVALQNILKFDGLFPKNVQSTGRYGAITAKAVVGFQRKHQIAPEAEIVSLEGRRVGPLTRAKLEELYPPL